MAQTIRDEQNRPPWNVRILSADGLSYITPGASAPASLYTTVAAVIAANGSVSGEVDTGGGTVVGLIMPGTWAAAVLTFQAAHLPAGGGGVYGDLYDDQGNEVQI